MTENFAYLQQQLPQTFNPKSLLKPGPSPHCHRRHNSRHAKNSNDMQPRRSRSPFRRFQNRHRQRHRSSSMRLRSSVRVEEVWAGSGYSPPSISLSNFKSPESNPLQGSRKSVLMQPAIRWFDLIFGGSFIGNLNNGHVCVRYSLNFGVCFGHTILFTTSVQGLNNGPICGSIS